MTRKWKIGEWRGVCFEVGEWDGVGADVDMSLARMFTHEAADGGPVGGLLHLDGAAAHVIQGQVRPFPRSLAKLPFQWLITDLVDCWAQSLRIERTSI